jgi:hypothetical protein
VRDIVGSINLSVEASSAFLCAHGYLEARRGRGSLARATFCPPCPSERAFAPLAASRGLRPTMALTSV